MHGLKCQSSWITYKCVYPFKFITKNWLFGVWTL
jgi:hypothetical protein